GNMPEARRLLQEAIMVADDSGDHVSEITALHDLVRLGDISATESLAAMADRVEGPWKETRLQHAVALSNSDADSLVGAARAFETTGAMLLAAEAASDAFVVRRRQRGDDRK